MFDVTEKVYHPGQPGLFGRTQLWLCFGRRWFALIYSGLENISQLLNGLTNDIRDSVEVQEFVEMDELLHKAIQVEQQLKRKGVAKRSFTNFGSSSWKDKGKKDGAATSSSSSSSSIFA